MSATETTDDKVALETGLAFTPRFDANGTIPAIATDAKTGDVVMFAWMNAEALTQTIATGIATYWSRSRKSLWVKGETSGNRQHVVDIRTDCDQDAILLSVTVEGHGASCHQGFRSCFYRGIPSETIGKAGDSTDITLEYRETERQFDPDKVYGQDG